MAFVDSTRPAAVLACSRVAIPDFGFARQVLRGRKTVTMTNYHIIIYHQFGTTLDQYSVFF